MAVSATALPAHWMKYRSFGEVEVCGYILPALVRTHLSGLKFTEPERVWLRGVVDNLAAALLRDAGAACCFETPGRLYTVRESVGSFALGLLPGIGMSETAQMVVWHALSLFISRAFHRRSVMIPREIESDVERARDIVGGWLLQWEVILAIDDRTAMPTYVNDLLTKFSAGAAH